MTKQRRVRIRTIGGLCIVTFAVVVLGFFMWQSLHSGPVGDVADADRDYSTELPVFPGAQGFGTDTLAGRGGQVIRVTTLASRGPGSLRRALAVNGPRVIVFDVSGIILLEDDLDLLEPYVTVAGQTAPASGITLSGAGLRIRTHDVLVQHLRVRPGDLPNGPDPENRDGISIEGNSDHTLDVSNIVVDHCSVSWAIDEGMATWHPGVRDVTISQCIIAENLSHSSHPKGEHSKGLLIGDHTKRVSVLGNLFAHNASRNPLMKGDTSVLVANNLVYDPGRLAVHFSDGGFLEGGNSGPTLATVVNNVVRGGPSSDRYFHPTQFHNVSGGTRVFWKDNLLTGNEEEPWSARSGNAIYRTATPPVRLAPLTLIPVEDVAEWVLANAGARPLERDAVDARVVKGVRAGAGRIIDSQDDVGGFTPIEPDRHSFELPDDPAADADGDGYTNLEERLHELANALEGN